MANVEFGTGKTVLILTIVAACFAVLWPKIFYPMLVSPSPGKTQSENLNGCCDVIFETDVNAIRIMSEMCKAMFEKHQDIDPKLSRVFQGSKFSKEIANFCRTEVMTVCGIDIAEFLNEKVRIGHSYKQILDEIRSFNISICLRQNFGINLGLLGTPRRMRIWGPTPPRHLRQERPIHLRPEMMHPALRERGRAIPQNNVAPKVLLEKDRNAKPPPIPGMRPPMGGPGHVVPPPKVGTTMSVVMPLYTIGIVVFSMYTVMKLFIRKTGGNDNYKDFTSDPEFRRVVFAEEYSNGCAGSLKEEGSRLFSKQDAPAKLWKTPSDDTTRLGWRERDTIMTAITGLLAEVDQQLSREGDTQIQYSTDLKEEKKCQEELCTEDTSPAKKESDQNEQVDNLKKDYLGDDNLDVLRDRPGGKSFADDSKPKVKVMGVETVAECEDGQKWSRTATPTLGVYSHGRGMSSVPSADVEPQNIFLEGTLPSQSQLLVTDSKTQRLTLPAEDDPEPPVILSGKMTLSLISLDINLSEDKDCEEAQPVPIHRYQCDFGNDVEIENEIFGDADSTLLDIDSAVIDEAGFLPQELENEETDENKNQYEHVNEKIDDDLLTNYTTATMSDGAEAAFSPETEDTGADFSNMEALDAAEDQEELQEDDHIWNETENQNSSPDKELSRNSSIHHMR